MQMTAKAVRVSLALSGAVMAIAAGLSQYLSQDGTITFEGLVLACGAAFVGWATRAPGTLTLEQADAHAAAVVREVSRRSGEP